MVSIFVRAGILTLLILGAWWLFSINFEGQRNTQLLGQIDAVITQESAIDAYLDYLESSDENERFCSVLLDHISRQNEKLFSLVQLLDQARYNNLENQYSLVRQRFQSANAQLFFSLKKFEKKCPPTEKLNQPILYFFPDNKPCSDCVLQAQILDQVRDACEKPIQIFAFPVEGGIETIDLLVKDYGIRQTPSLVIEDTVYPGVQSPSFLNEKLGCQN